MTSPHPDHELHQRFVDRVVEAMRMKPTFTASSVQQLGRIRTMDSWETQIGPGTELRLEWSYGWVPNMLIELPTRHWPVPFVPKGDEETLSSSMNLRELVPLWRDAFRILMASDLPDAAFRADLRRIAAMTVLLEEFSQP